MAKADLTFSGIDSACRAIEAARRVDGQWYYRSYGYNGYGNSWSKWIALEDMQKHILEDGRLEWGFKTLAPLDLGNIRLPNN